MPSSPIIIWMELASISTDQPTKIDGFRNTHKAGWIFSKLKSNILFHKVPYSNADDHLNIFVNFWKFSGIFFVSLTQRCPGQCCVKLSAQCCLLVQSSVESLSCTLSRTALSQAERCSESVEASWALKQLTVLAMQYYILTLVSTYSVMLYNIVLYT